MLSSEIGYDDEEKKLEVKIHILKSSSNVWAFLIARTGAKLHVEDSTNRNLVCLSYGGWKAAIWTLNMM